MGTHDCELDIDNIPEGEKATYVLLGIHQDLLVGVAPLCDAGCKVTFTREEVNMMKEDKTIWKELGKLSLQTSIIRDSFQLLHADFLSP